MALRSKFVTSRSQKLGLTHFLAIPLVPATSRSQFRDSFKCFWDDLAAIDVPTDAIRPLGLLHLSLETSLSLKTPEHIAKATEILRELSVKQTLPTIHRSLLSANHCRHSSRALTASNDETKNSMAPPSVSISGLFCRPGTEAEASRLNAKVYDATHRVRDWKLRIAHAYQAAGLSRRASFPYHFQTRAAMKRLLDSSDGTIKLMRIPESSELVPCKWQPAKLVRPLLPPFERPRPSGTIQRSCVDREHSVGED